MAGDRSDVKVRFLGDDAQLSRVFGRVEKVADRTHGKFSKVGGALGKVGLVAGGALAAGVAAGGAALWKAGEAAAEDAAGQSQLEGVLQRTNKATKGQVKAVEEWISKTSLATGVADDQLRPALGRLLNAGVKTGDAQKQLALAMDISAATGKDLNTVTAAMGKAALGSTGGLSKLGLATKDAKGEALSYDEILKGASKTMGGAAAKAAETTQGKMARLKLRFSELQETVGGGVVDALDKVVGVFSRNVLPVLEDLGEKVVPVLQRAFKNDLGPALQTVGRFVSANVVPVLKVLGGFIAGTLIPAVVKIGSAIMGGLRSAFESINASVQKNRPGLEKLGAIFMTLAKFVVSVLGPALAFILGNALKATGAIIGKVLIPAVVKLGDMFTWLWNKVVAPVIRFMLNGFASIATFYANMLRGLSKVPGFGWAAKAATALDKAAGKARSLASGVKSIPNGKTVSIHYKMTAGGAPVDRGRINVPGVGWVNAGQRARGGPIAKGAPYIVGEEGPELVFPKADGTVVDAATTRALMRGGSRGGSSSGAAVAGGGGGPTYVYITVQGAIDPLGTARQIRELLRKLTRVEGVELTFGGAPA